MKEKQTKVQTHVAAVIKYVVSRENKKEVSAKNLTADLKRVPVQVVLNRADWPNNKLYDGLYEQTIRALKQNLDVHSDSTYEEKADPFIINFSAMVEKIIEANPNNLEAILASCQEIFVPFDMLEAGISNKLVEKIKTICIQSWLNNTLGFFSFKDPALAKNLAYLKPRDSTKMTQVFIKPDEISHNTSITNVNVFQEEYDGNKTVDSEFFLTFDKTGSLEELNITYTNKSANSIKFHPEGTLVLLLLTDLIKNLDKRKGCQSQKFSDWVGDRIRLRDTFSVKTIVQQLLLQLQKEPISNKSKSFNNDFILGFIDFFNEVKQYGYVTNWIPVVNFIYNHSEGANKIKLSEIFIEMLKENKHIAQKDKKQYEKYPANEISPYSFYLRNEFLEGFITGKYSLVDVQKFVNSLTDKQDAITNIFVEINKLAVTHAPVFAQYHLKLEDIKYNEFIGYLLQLRGRGTLLNDLYNKINISPVEVSDRLKTILKICSPTEINEPTWNELIAKKPIQVHDNNKNERFIYIISASSVNPNIEIAGINLTWNGKELCDNKNKPIAISSTIESKKDGSELQFLGLDSGQQHIIMALKPAPTKFAAFRNLARFFSDAINFCLNRCPHPLKLFKYKTEHHEHEAVKEAIQLASDFKFAEEPLPAENNLTQGSSILLTV